MSVDEGHLTPEQLLSEERRNDTEHKLTGDGGVPPQITDLANARRLVAAHGEDLRYAPELGMWLAWNGRRWAEDATGEASRRAKDVVDALRSLVLSAGTDSAAQRKLLSGWQRSQQSSRIEGMLRLAATEPGVPVLAGALDADPWLLNVADGTVELTTGMRRDHRRDDLITKLAPVDYEGADHAPTFHQFLNRVLPDPDVRTFVQRALGSSLTADVGDQVLFIANGPGANGKSTLLNLIRRILGGYAVQLPPELLMASKHDAHPTGLTDLRGVRFALTIEVEQGRRLAEALVKMLTGGERIRARRMRQDFFEFSPTHKIWLACNHLPLVHGADDGIWRRILVVPFNVTIPEHERDGNLPEKLWAERTGILIWLLDGCLAWHEHGLMPPASVVGASNRYRTEQDHLGGFLEACCTINEHARADAKVLRTRYEKWCAEAGDEPITKAAFGRELADRGYPSSRDRRSRLGLGMSDTPQLNSGNE
jgi:putative DNA primase/helicase